MSTDALKPSKLGASRLGRLARLTGVGIRAKTSSLFGESEPAAKKAAEVLGELRGIAAKMGQMSAYVDGIIPEEQREPYEKWMKGLMSNAPASSPESIRRVIEQDLGGSPQTLFAEWEPEPFASASVGQVHRARMHDGRRVAVKVQHPEVAQAIRSDLENAKLLQAAIRALIGPKFESKRLLAEIRTRFTEELDYRLEASRQERFRRIHADDRAIRVPEVVAERSSARVLTSEFCDGLSFDEACDRPEGERAQWSATLWRFVYRGTLDHGVFNADPHPGNYLFGPDGEVTFVDFGCVQTVPEPRRLVARRLHWAASTGDKESFRSLAPSMLDTRGGRYESQILRYLSRVFEPQFSSPFRHNKTYAASMAAHVRRMFEDALKGEGDDYVALPEGIVFLNRLQFGFYSVLARLDAEVDYAAIDRALLQNSGIEAELGPT